MTGARVWFVVAFAGAAFVAAPAAAQEPPPDSTTTTTTTLPPGGPPSTVDASSTTTTVLGPPTSTDTTTTSTTAPPEDPAANGDAPSETVPDGDWAVIPPRPPTAEIGGQPSFANYPARVVRVSARAARARAAEAQAVLDAVSAQLVALQAQQVTLQTELGRLAIVERRAIAALHEAQLELEERAVDAYVRGNVDTMVVLFAIDGPAELAHRNELLESVLEGDVDAVEHYREARAAVDSEQAELAAALAATDQQVAAAQASVAAAQHDVELAGRELAVTLAGGTLVIHGFTFPVAPPHQFGDSFGAPRMTGTQYEHWHEGTDIFAPAGTELLATERGVVTRMGTNVLGGITVWLKGESGTSYYYAHLVSYAPGVRVGLLVEPATVLGYVGNTGNARTTPPHLHFEIHPGGGLAINPHPLLIVADQQVQPTPIRL